MSVFSSGVQRVNLRRRNTIPSPSDCQIRVGQEGATNSFMGWMALVFSWTIFVHEMALNTTFEDKFRIIWNLCGKCCPLFIYDLSNWVDWLGWSIAFVLILIAIKNPNDRWRQRLKIYSIELHMLLMSNLLDVCIFNLISSLKFYSMLMFPRDVKYHYNIGLHLMINISLLFSSWEN